MISRIFFTFTNFHLWFFTGSQIFHQKSLRNSMLSASINWCHNISFHISRTLETICQKVKMAILGSICNYVCVSNCHGMLWRSSEKISNKFDLFGNFHRSRRFHAWNLMCPFWSWCHPDCCWNHGWSYPWTDFVCFPN